MYISRVRPVLKNLIIASTLAALAPSLCAVAPAPSILQYQSIPDRNAFGLRPPPSPTAVTNAPAALPKITLTGITTILGNKRALMKVAPVGLKPQDPTKETSIILTEGQREGGIEVLQIDENRGSVKVNNSGTVMLLTFEKDGAKLPAAVPGSPGLVPVPTALPLPNGRHPGPFPGGIPPLPGRTVRTPMGSAANGPAAVSPVGSPAANAAAADSALQAALSNQDLTPEEQEIVKEIQRQAAANNLSYPSLAPNVPNQPTPPEVQTTAPAPVNGTIPVRPGVLVPQ